MFDVRIILVEPAGALNVGAVARVMKNMGLSQLWLVNPQFDFQEDRYGTEAQHMAVHGQDILEAASIVKYLPEALAGCQRAIATAGRIDPGSMRLETPVTGLSWLSEVETSAIVFGPEDRGLSNSELQYCQQVMKIPVDDTYPSLNLAQAVGICCYQLRLLNQSAEPTSQIDKHLVKSATIDAIEAYYEQLEEVLLTIGYLYPHTAFSRMQKIRRLFNRSDLTESELAMLRGILRQVSWAVSKGNTSPQS